MSRTKTAPTIEIVANGEQRTIPDGQTLAGFLAARELDPDVVVVERNGEIVDVKVEYPDDFTAQMLEYAEQYSLLPTEN